VPNAQRSAAMARLQALVPGKSWRQSAHILGHEEAFKDNGKLCLVMEAAPHGSLQHVMQRCCAAKQCLHPDDVWSFLIQMARGLQACSAIPMQHTAISRSKQHSRVMRTNCDTRASA
jgi:hypothetical protein